MIKIFDTTLRDGEQSPGASLNTQEKIQIALQLEKLGVDIIEAGFAITSKDDFKAISLISQKVKQSTICSLSRAVDKDIDASYQALKKAQSPRIHTFIGTSPTHIQYILRKTQDQVLQMAVKAVTRASSYVSDVEFSAMDASRTDIDYLCRVVQAAVGAGASTINIPDTVGYSIPSEWYKFIKRIIERVPCLKNSVILSVHCHNDLGLATANSIAAVEAGAHQIECAINGLGERGGNASLEEVVMSLRTRQKYFSDQGNKDTKINIKKIYPTSSMVSKLTGIAVQRNKAVVGQNAFAHESGVHQDGILKNRETFEIMKAEDVGWPCNKIVLGKHSGRHAIKSHLKQLSIELNNEEMEKFYIKFKKMADKKKEIFDRDLKKLLAQL
jgi:2-isopropylmalate synthase